MEGKSAEIHLSDGKIYSTRMTFAALEEMLGDGFIKAHRGCIVSAMAIHEISDMIDLVNGEKLEYRMPQEEYHNRKSADEQKVDNKRL